MKISFQHPDTGKRSSVTIADWWIELFEKACELDPTYPNGMDLVAKVNFWAETYYRCPEMRKIYRAATFTQFCESAMAITIKGRLK